MPMPPSPLLLTKGLKRFSFMSGDTPGPSSSTAKTTCPFLRDASTPICRHWAVAWTALRTRFTSTWVSFWRSPWTGGRPSSMFTATLWARKPMSMRDGQRIVHDERRLQDRFLDVEDPAARELVHRLEGVDQVADA